MNSRKAFEKEFAWDVLSEDQKFVTEGSCWSVWQKAWSAAKEDNVTKFTDREVNLQFAWSSGWGLYSVKTGRKIKDDFYFAEKAREWAHQNGYNTEF